MPAELVGLDVDAHDPELLAAFWSGVLGRTVADDGVTLLTDDDLQLWIRFLPTDVPKTQPNQIHFDLTSSSADDQRATVDRVLGLGGRHLDIGQGDVDHVVMADPEGNELCVIEPGNGFLADTGTIGALSSDGSQAVGYFWSEALDWPLVWDQDEETAIQSPRGGSKISWGGPPLRVKVGRNRLRLALSPGDVDQHAAVDRLLALGASRVDTGRQDADLVALADPDGNEFCVMSR